MKKKLIAQTLFLLYYANIRFFIKLQWCEWLKSQNGNMS